jgi:carboxymethylenebutenolidase
VDTEDNRADEPIRQMRSAVDARESRGMTRLALTFPAFTVAPAAAADRRGPGIIVVHEGNGMSAQLLRFSERLADEGYLVIAPDFFSRSHDVDPNDFPAMIASVTPENLKGDFATAAEALRRDGATSVGVTGFCLGGRFTYQAAKWAGDLGLGAAAPFYGGGIARVLGEPGCPTLLFFGGQDVYIPPADIEKVEAHHGSDAVVVYPDAPHAFMHDGSAHYDPEAAADAWTRLLDFFAANLT